MSAPNQGERRLAAIMFTDIVGYTAMTQSSESRTLSLLETHNSTLRHLFPQFNGREVKTIGDSFLVEFASALDAIRCAVEIQSQLHEAKQSPGDGSPIRLRIGIHLGDVVHRDGDVLGDAVNISSRIESVAEPEGVCISRQVYDQVRNKFELPMLNMGEKELKNVSVPTEVFSVVMPWSSKQQGAAAPPEARRVAVLPFSNMSPDPVDEYFADGLTEELISTVSRIEGAEVISRTSVMQYKKAPKPIREISRELDAGTVLEGSVRKSGNRLRVTVQMIDAGKDRHVWAESYDRTMDDVFAIQSEIAGKVADALRTRMAIGSPSSAGGTENLEAYTDYLQAIHVTNETGLMYPQKGIELLKSAIAKDPRFVKAWAMLAHLYRRQGGFGNYAESMQSAWEAATRALELGPDCAEAHAAAAAVHQALDRFPEARHEVEVAIRLNPNLSGAYNLLGEVTAAFGNLDEAVGYYRKAYSLDPLSSGNAHLFSMVLSTNRMYDEALQVIARQEEVYPNTSQIYEAKAGVFMEMGDLAKAEETINKGLAMRADSPDLTLGLGILRARQGRKEEAESILAGFDSAGISMRLMANVLIRTALGDYERAFDALMEQARVHSWAFLVKTASDLEPLRKNPRWPEFCKAVGIPP